MKTKKVFFINFWNLVFLAKRTFSRSDSDRDIIGSSDNESPDENEDSFVGFDMKKYSGEFFLLCSGNNSIAVFQVETTKFEAEDKLLVGQSKEGKEIILGGTVDELMSNLVEKRFGKIMWDSQNDMLMSN
jgi:hypothetical protein